MNQPAPHRAIRVLLVEDSLPLRGRLRSLIEESCPVQIVGEAGSVAEALALHREHEPDAVVLDMGLPDGDGRVVLNEIKRTQPACVVIVLTSFGDEVFRECCLAAGADYFLNKGLEFERVPELLRTMTSIPR